METTLYQKKVRDFILQIAVGPQKLKVFLEISKQSESAEGFVSKEEIEDCLREQGIIFGVQKETLQGIVRDRILGTPVLIAKGQAAVPGENGRVQYLHTISGESIHLKNPDGSVDYKQVKWFTQVKEGEVLAKIIKASPGVAGTDVFGKEIAPAPGREAFLQLGRNVQLDGQCAKALKSGRLEQVGGRLSVNEVLVIEHDVDISTGHVHFNGDIVVRGDIKPGYQVVSKGGLEVHGIIEGSDVYCGGDLVVRGGIQGAPGTRIESFGKLICRFIENATIVCKDTLCTDTIIQSQVECAKEVLLKGRKGLIAGGQVQAGVSITAQVIGSAMGTRTCVGVGNDLAVERQAYALQTKLDHTQRELQEMSVSIQSGRQLFATGSMSPEKKKLFIGLLERYNQAGQEVEQLKKSLQEIEKERAQETASHIQVRERLYAGTIVNIGTAQRYIKDETGPCKLTLQEGEINLHKG